MDVGDDLEITLDIKSNLFRDVTKITSNNTYTINLPKTVHNMSAIDWAAKPKSGSRYPYAFHKAQYFRNGLEIIKDGRATLMSVGDNIEISIYWGLFPAFTKLQEDELKLNELNTTRHIAFNKSNEPYTYERALSEDVFYAKYDTTQFKTSSDEWVGNDKTEGKNKSMTYELTSGKIKTGTATGAHVSGAIEDDEGYRCAIVDFSAGMKATVSRVLSWGDYRAYAILDKNMNVLEIAQDSISKEFDTLDNIPSIDPMLSSYAKANDIVANINTTAMNVVEIKLRLPDNNPAGTIEYGAIDPDTWQTEKWGEMSVDANAGEFISIQVTKFKEEGKLIYLKPSVNGLVYYVMTTGKYSYWGKDNKVEFGWLYNVKYTSDSQPYKVEVQATSTSAWLVVNTTTKYNTSTQLTITSVTESRAMAVQTSVSNDDNSHVMFETDAPIQPSVSCNYILDLITQQTGVKFGWSDPAKEIIKGLVVPLVTRKADSVTLDGGISGNFQDTNAIGVLGFMFNRTANTLFAENEKGIRYKQLTAKTNFTMIFDVQMFWSWDASTAKPQGHRNWSLGGAEVSEAFYSYPPNYIEVKVVSIHNDSQDESEYTKTYIAGTKSQTEEGYYAMITDSESNKINGRFIHLVTGYGAIELKEGDIVTFTMKNGRDANLKGLRCYNGTLKATVKESDQVPYGGNYPIGINLPDVKVVDFIKTLQLILAVFPAQNFSNGAISFIDLDGLWKRRNEAKDWSKKLVPSQESNIPRTCNYVVDGYCQHNKYKWKEDDTVSENHDAEMLVSNNTLEYQQNTWTIPFAASDGNRIPIYAWKSVTSVFGRTSFVTERATEYKACKDRIMNLVNVGGVACLRFDIDIQSIFNTKYNRLTKSLSSAHVIKERFILRDLEILEFDETIPIYLAQYGAYFAVTELKTSNDGYTEATMLQLEF